MNIKLIVLAIISIFTTVAHCQLNIIKDILQYNVAGIPLFHKTLKYEFDPDVALRRRKQFEELNGIKGEKLIERLGLGIDGYTEERLARQRARDEGRLGGVNNLLP